MNIDLHLVDDSQNTVLHIIFFDIQKLEEKVNGRRIDPLACTCSATDLKNSTFYIVGFASHSSRLNNGLNSDLKVQLHGSLNQEQNFQQFYKVYGRCIW